MSASIGLFRCPPELGAFSMNRYADGVASGLTSVFGGRYRLAEVALPRSAAAVALGSLPLVGRISRYARQYPRYLLYARRSRFAVNHVLDHAYGHLTYALDPERTIVTCHDVLPLRLWRGMVPGVAPRRVPPITAAVSFLGLRRARFVVADSNATRDDLVALVGVAPERVRVVRPGLDERFHPLSDDERRDARRRFPLGGEGARHILSVSTGAPSKNERATLEVLARVRAQLGDDVYLVRRARPMLADERRHAARLGVLGAIVEVPPVAAEDLSMLYGRCDVLLFPSLLEGFGWPPLEAMACGVPVVCSTADALRETVDGAALTADGRDYDALAAHVCAVLSDSALAGDLTHRGADCARHFTWEAAAVAIAELYETVLEEQGT